jgi:protein TonB
MKRGWNFAAAIVLIFCGLAAAKADVPQRIQVPSDVSTGLLIKKVLPKYPKDARKAHIQGQVILHAVIDKEGNVQDIQLISGHELLAPAAIEAVKQWKYKPYRLNGEPVSFTTKIVVNFALGK